MNVQIISLFPEMFHGVLNTSMLWKAQEKKAVTFRYIQLRDFGLGKRQVVDDTPYGGGDGMLLRPEPLIAAIEYAKTLCTKKPYVVLMTPRGKRYTQVRAKSLAKKTELIFVCARYEGYDERITPFIDEQISVGDYVLTGGELPAMTVIDSVVRLLPGVLGGEKSAEIESFSDGQTLEFPQYTRPEVFRDQSVPKVLLSGNHAEIAAWRTKESKQADK